MVSPGILINVLATTLVWFLLPLGRHYTLSKNLKKGTVIVQLVQQPEVRLVDKLSMAQWCSLVAKTIEQHCGLHWDKQQQKGGHQPLYSPLVRSSGVLYPVLGSPADTRNVESFCTWRCSKPDWNGKDPSNLLEVALFWAGRLLKFQRSEPQPFCDSVPLIVG